MAPAGWDTADQINNHKLATSIINGHGTDNDAVLDDSELSILSRFCSDPSTANRDKIVEEQALREDTGNSAAEKAAKKGSLAAFLVARHGTERPALDERDIVMLKEWFGKGMPVGESVVR